MGLRRWQVLTMRRSLLDARMNRRLRADFRGCRKRQPASSKILSKYPLEDRIDMFGVIAKVEFFTQLGFGQRCHHVLVSEKFLKEISALLPHPHGVALHQP